MTRRILITNDDGIHAPGLAALADALRQLGEVTIIAPDRECSAVSHSFTLHRPLRATVLDSHCVVLDGTPVDCVIFARTYFQQRNPDLLVSGINNGPNLGHDIYYSGTVAAAHEGQINGIPSIAVSLNSSYSRDVQHARASHFPTAAQLALRVAQQVLERGLPEDVFLNLNVPDVALDQLRGVRVVRLGQRIYRDVMVKRVDPRGAEYYWVGGDPPAWVCEAGTDFEAIHQGYAALTPVRFQVNDTRVIEDLASWPLNHLQKET